MQETTMGMVRDIPGLGFDDAIERATAALAEEGFGILTEIDAKATFKKKLDVDFRPFRILGACNPSLAHQSLTTSAAFGLMMPCNVVVEAMDDGVRISVADPAAMAKMAGVEDMDEITGDARARLARAIESV